jgi:hypothetical protein
MKAWRIRWLGTEIVKNGSSQNKSRTDGRSVTSRARGGDQEGLTADRGPLLGCAKLRSIVGADQPFELGLAPGP